MATIDPDTGESGISKAKTTRFVLVVILASQVLACSASYSVRVNGYRAAATSEFLKTARIAVSRNPEAANPILESEVASKIETLLATRGYAVGGPRSPDFLVKAGYGIGDPARSTTSFPVYEGGGVATTTTIAPGGGVYSSTTHLPGTISSIPISVTTYRRYLDVTVFDVRQTSEGTVVWIGSAISSGRSSDLRTALNYMLVPLFDHFGMDTGEEIHTTISEGDPEVRTLIQGRAPSE